MLDACPWGTRRPCRCPGLAPAGQEGPYLLSWVFSEPLDHVLQFPERDGVGSESRPGSRPGRTRLGAEGRAAELAASGDARTGPGTCQESFREEPPRLPEGTRRGWEEGGWPWGGDRRGDGHMGGARYSLGELLVCEGSATDRGKRAVSGALGTAQPPRASSGDGRLAARLEE